MSWPPESAESLWERLQPLLPGLSVELVAELDSTNTQLLNRARQGDVSPCLLVAEHQTAGRGRQGRPWQSRPGASLTFSLGLELAPGDWSGLSLAVGVALAQALHEQVRIKWPNDLWLAERKLGGILIETASLAAGRRYVVIGVGLNVLPVAAGVATASISEWWPGMGAPELLDRLAEPLVRGVLQFQDQGLRPFLPAFAQRDALAGRRVRTTLPDVPQGLAQGVDDQGRLLVHTDRGLQAIASGEVSVRPC